jgi:cyanophycinase-like exopeptidase
MPDSAYNWIVQHALHGDIVIIGNDNGKENFMHIVDAIRAAATPPGTNHSLVDSIEVFDFDVTYVAGDEPSDVAKMVAGDTGDAAADQKGEGKGREFLDRIHDAEGVFFLGGDQWIYYDLFKGTVVASRISSQNNQNKIAVGGTSAGLAILGDDVFSARYIRNDELLSEEIAGPTGSYTDADFWQEGMPSVEDGPFSFSLLSGILTETHFSDRNLEAQRGIDGTYRLGRFLVFLNSLLIGSPYGWGRTEANEIAVDQGTALTIERVGNGTQAQVLGSGKVYFASVNLIGQTVSVDGPVGGQMRLTTPPVYLRWFGPGDGLNSMANGWQTAPAGTAYAEYRLEDGQLRLVEGVRPPFPQ